MFIYLSKKIAIPNGVKLRSLGWNGEQGWIACGGENGLLKVLKLENASGPAPTAGKGGGSSAAASNSLSMNQTLEGHQGAVVCVTWNDQFRKLTTSDENGLIIVWMMHKGSWMEEMINNRNKSVVRAMRWTGDGHKICIVYEDGAVIVGSVDGNRLWGKELKLQLSQIEWSPDARTLLFGTSGGEVHLYESNMGNPLGKIPIYCLEDGIVPLAGIDWYDGGEGFVDPTAPTLAICFTNGRCQLMHNEQDEKPVLIDTGMAVSRIKWNNQGTVLAVGGMAPSEGSSAAAETPAIQFYSHHGQHLRTIKIPGTSLAGVAWEGSGLRISFAVDSFIYFANVRPDYKWGYFKKTLVYAFPKLDRPESCVIFWNTKTGEKHVKFVKKLLAVKGCADNCVLAAKTEDAAAPYILILCNSIGSPVDSKHIDFEPLHYTMTATHIIVSSEEHIFVWQYRSQSSKLGALDAAAPAALRRKEGRERVFHVDDSTFGEDDGYAGSRSAGNFSGDSICCITANEHHLLVGRDSGLLQQYTLPLISLENKISLPVRPHSIFVNCNTTKVAVLDINGTMTMIELAPSSSVAPSASNSSGSSAPKRAAGPIPNFERKDVWDVKWADDNPDLFAIMEKTRMYIYRGLDPEEPVLSSAYICKFKNLKIKAVMLDDVMQDPDVPKKDSVVTFETRALRDTRDILAKVSIQDAYTFIQDNPHPRLWKLLAEAALERLEFTVADKAFVRCSDYQGIQFVKRLRLLDSKEKQKAEVAVYFSRFEEAERIYKDVDRKELAVQMRMNLGDWFRVVQLVQEGAGDESLVPFAWNNIGQYYADRQKWSLAVQYFTQAKNFERLIECHYQLEDFVSLERLIHTLPEGSPHLATVGAKFQSVGICESAVQAFLRGGEIKAAVDCCVDLNQWDQAVQLAERHNFKEIEQLLGKYASHLTQSNRLPEAIELYRKAGQSTETARLLAQLAQDAAKTKGQALTAKKLYVLAALEVEQHRKRVLDSKVLSGAGSNVVAAALGGLLADDASTGHDKTLDQAWRGAEAYHFFLLAQRQLYEGKNEDALRCALLLTDYTDILDGRQVHSLVALAAFHAKHYATCSSACMQLETMAESKGDMQMLERLQKLATAIFVRHPPKDPFSATRPCMSCGYGLKDWQTSCPSCSTLYPPCVVTGRPITGVAYHCRHCKHRAFENEAYRLRYCALCHSAVK